MLNDKIVLITGGTGTVGTALIEFILNNYTPKVIRIFSRDEDKQFHLSNKYKEHSEKLRFFIGDIRDKERLNRAMTDVDIVFHLAALKQVVACEYNPFEAIKTNVLGIQNLIDTCIEKDVEKLIFTSTDKAATPCNTMGVTKLLGEKLITAANHYKGDSKTIFFSVRFGNVLGSRGSLVPLIKKQVLDNLPVTLTHNEMTRYIMGTNSALELIIKTLEIAQGGEIFVLKMKVVKIIEMIEVLIDHFAKKYNKKIDNIQIKEIGMFIGEKLYEELFSIEESERVYEMKDMYIIFPQLKEYYSREINLKKYPDLKKFDVSKPFNTRDGPFLSKEEILDFLKENEII